MKTALLSREPTQILSITPFYGDEPTPVPLFSNVVDCIAASLSRLIPEKLLLALLEAQRSQTLSSVFPSLEEALPLMAWTYDPQKPNFACFSLFCLADFTHGVGRYFIDILSRWLTPGKVIPVYSANSLRFTLTGYPKEPLFFHQMICPISTNEDLKTIDQNFPLLRSEMALNIRAVIHARKIVTTKRLSAEQMKILLKEQLSSLFSRENKEFETGLLEQIHSILIKTTAEDKIDQIKQQLTTTLQSKTEPYDRDIFSEMQHFVSFFSQSFAATRKTSHLTRLVSFYYLFRKNLQNQVQEAPDKRHLSLKLFRSFILEQEQQRPVLGVLIALNLLKEHELFDTLHALEAVQHCLPHAELVPHSSVTDRQNQHKMRILYFEVQKGDNTPFSLEETSLLRQRLPLELKASVENVVNTVFMPRNDEEVMRSIVLLANELKYVDDIPQVVVHFDRQTEQEILFIVIFLRILRPPIKEMRDLTANDPSIRVLEIKKVGTLRKRYHREASVFHIAVAKKPYMRKDFSLDLFKARQQVIVKLEELFGPIRDYNGGLLAKQHEVYFELHKSLSPYQKTQDYILENLFYSLTPVITRSTLPLVALRHLFCATLAVADHDFTSHPSFLHIETIEECILILFATPEEKKRDQLLSLIEQLDIPATNLSYTLLEAYEAACLGLILRTDHPLLPKKFSTALLKLVKENS